MKSLSTAIYEKIADDHERGLLKGELDHLVKAALVGASAALKECSIELSEVSDRVKDGKSAYIFRETESGR